MFGVLLPENLPGLGNGDGVGSHVRAFPGNDGPVTSQSDESRGPAVDSRNELEVGGIWVDRTRPAGGAVFLGVGSCLGFHY